MTTLVMGAYAPELAGLTAGSDVEARAIGVGLVEASAGAERAIAELRPSRIILVGTAGSLPIGAALAIGEVAVVRSAHLALRAGESAPEPMPLEAHADVALSAQLADALQARLVRAACPLGITETDSEAERLAEHADIEHLEAFAVLRAAERAKIPAVAILSIANRAGDNARSEWRAHHTAAESTALQALAQALR